MIPPFIDTPYILRKSISDQFCPMGAKKGVPGCKGLLDIVTKRAHGYASKKSSYHPRRQVDVEILT